MNIAQSITVHSLSHNPNTSWTPQPRAATAAAVAVADAAVDVAVDADVDVAMVADAADAADVAAAVAHHLWPQPQTPRQPTTRRQQVRQLRHRHLRPRKMLSWPTESSTWKLNWLNKRPRNKKLVTSGENSAACKPFPTTVALTTKKLTCISCKG